MSTGSTARLVVSGGAVTGGSAENASHKVGLKENIGVKKNEATLFHPIHANSC